MTGNRTRRSDMGTLRDTYHAALQHEHVTPDDGDLVLGVVREPMYGIQSLIDENIPELAPPSKLLREFKTKADKHGHNMAVEAVGFVPRYWDHLTSEEPQQYVDSVISELEAGRDVWLVCFENTDEKFCHRTELKQHIEQRADYSTKSGENVERNR